LLERIASRTTPAQLAAVEQQLSRVPFAVLLLGLLVQALGAGATVNAAAALGEETGWRGYLYERLAGLGFWRASLATGALWGAWHVPLILQGHNFPQHPRTGAFLMVAWCTLLGPLLHHLREKTGSTVAVAVAHGTLNASAGAVFLLVRGGTDLQVGVTGLTGVCVAALGVMVLAVVRRNR
jgi:membrane protease YdiL (CAAX protease family)